MANQPAVLAGVPDTRFAHTNDRFVARVRHTQAGAKARGTPLADVSPEERDRLWEDAKKAEDVV